jgi:prolyl oligopeptidase
MRRLSVGARLFVLAPLIVTIGACAGGGPDAPAAGPPETSRKPVTDTYHEISVDDDYRWLEDWDDPRVQSWSEAQSAYARAVLERMPAVDRIRDRVAEILEAESPSHSRMTWCAGKLFAVKNQPPKQQPFLVLTDPERPDEARVLVDPNQIDPSGGTTIDWYKPSPDGERVAVSLSRGGSESGDVHLFDVDSGRQVDVVIPRVNGGTAGGDLAWTADASGIFYTRYPRPGERPDGDLDFYQQVWFHRLGAPLDEDRYELGQDFPRIAEIRLQRNPASDAVLATMQDGDSSRFQHYVRGTDGTWLQLTRYDDRIVQAEWAPDGSLFLISYLDAPRGRLLRLAADRLGADGLAAAQPVVDQGENTIVYDFYGASPMVVTRQHVYLTYQLGGPSTIRAFDHRGKPVPGPDVLPVSRIRQIVAVEDDAILYRNESYLDPPAWYRFDPANGETVRSALFQESPVDFSGVEVVREWVTSKDGTRVPLTILKPEGASLDGSNPTLLTGYGGYGLSREPRFDPLNEVWLERGGVLAVANIRGGGEFGEEWHRAGMLTRKQNVFDDFAAAMQHLIDRGYTSSDRLAIKGGSNGGLLMGAMITQVPERCRAVVSSVGIYDMLRVELSPNGAFNIPEFGTVEDPDQFRALHAYSPYHNVPDGIRSAAILFMTGANDPRVDPMQSRKMTALLQAVKASDHPVLLRTSGDTGHGSGTPLSAEIEEETDIYAFLFNELGVEY